MYLYFSHADPVHPEEDGIDGPGGEDGVEHPLEVAGHALGPVDGGHHLQDGEVTLSVLSVKGAATWSMEALEPACCTTFTVSRGWPQMRPVEPPTQPASTDTVRTVTLQHHSHL